MGWIPKALLLLSLVETNRDDKKPIRSFEAKGSLLQQEVKY